ncbi:hypothetical protein NH340_JMT06243 [Sarcoptes scabiei]|nr:hypothetical protein NH340_JMT06243 [Sarcoptes scabiei]
MNSLISKMKSNVLLGCKINFFPSLSSPSPKTSSKRLTISPSISISSFSSPLNSWSTPIMLIASIKSFRNEKSSSRRSTIYHHHNYRSLPNRFNGQNHSIVLNVFDSMFRMFNLPLITIFMIFGLLSTQISIDAKLFDENRAILRQFSMKTNKNQPPSSPSSSFSSSQSALPFYRQDLRDQNQESSNHHRNRFNSHQYELQRRPEEQRQQRQSEEKKLFKCQDQKSICGFMQFNSAGLNRVPLCSCNENVDCHLAWNLFDRRIVRHGSDFYKVNCICAI